MALIKAIHVECDGCNIRIPDITTSRYTRYGSRLEHAIRRMRQQGWTHGKRDLCPKCQPGKEKA
jgi:hypothetical protein